MLLPAYPGYLQAVATWARADHLQPGLCQLDMPSMRWVADPSLAGPGTS
jgi:hypothetical protein